MHRTTGIDSKSKSKHSKQPPKELRKNRTEKDLHSATKPPLKKTPQFGRSSSNRDLHVRRQPPQLHVQSQRQFEFFRGSLPANKLDTPKWNLHYRKHEQNPSPSPMLQHTRTEQQQIRRIEREILVEKPKIMKQKTESYAQLQLRLKSLEQKLELLKGSMVRSESRNGKSRSKDRKSQQSEEQKNEEMFVQARVLNSYVTQVKPVPRKHVPPPDTLSSKAQVPYYLGHLSKHTRKSKLECPVYEHILQSITTINYMRRVVRPTEAQLEKRMVTLKLHSRNLGRKTVIFDLDETLIHCNEVQARCDVKLPIIFPNGERISAGVNIRPHAREILESLAKSFEVVVFTASHSCYANVVLDHLDPGKKLISHRLFRQHCFETESGMYIKDLRVIRNRELSQMVLVDNAAYSYYFQLDNGIPIIPFYNNRKDCELLNLEHFLIDQVLPCSDVRTVLRERFHLHRYGQFSSPSKMINQLYL